MDMKFVPSTAWAMGTIASHQWHRQIIAVFPWTLTITLSVVLPGWRVYLRTHQYNDQLIVTQSALVAKLHGFALCACSIQ